MSYHLCPMCGTEGAFGCQAVNMGTHWTLASVGKPDGIRCCTFDLEYDTQEKAEKAALSYDMAELDHERKCESDDYYDDYFWGSPDYD